ncbi:MAG: hypothetical protein NTZ10_01070 [Candidatus Saganbacteria bacterium]|nr:hypothetical protein [Candidatus Saganbacteria bacterium]
MKRYRRSKEKTSISMTGQSQGRQYKNALYKFLYFPIILAILVSASFSSDSGQEIPVSLKAQHLKFDQDSGIISASGSVEAEFQDVTLYADSLKVNTGTKIATAEGNVRLKRKDYEASGSKMVYDMESETAHVKDFRASLSPSEMKGKLFLDLEDVDDEKNIKYGHNGNATTCDLAEPHYHMDAGKFYFKPDDKVVGVNVTAFVGNTPVMWFPFYIYDLAKRKVSLMVPVIGSNDIEGNFLKSEIAYFFGFDKWGSVYVDLMSKKGVGYGIEHNYKLNEKNSGKLYVYHVYESDTGIPDWVVKLDHKVKLSKYTNLALGYDYRYIYLVPNSRLDQTGYKIGLDYNNGKDTFATSLDVLNNRISSLGEYTFRIGRSDDMSRTNYMYNTRNSIAAAGWQNESQSFSHNQWLFSKDLNISLAANYFRNVTAEGYAFDQRLDPTVEINWKGKGFNLRVTEATYIDPDTNSYTADENVEYVEKLPEAVLTLDTTQFATVNVKSEVAYGKYHESKYIPATNSQRHYTAERFKEAATFDKVFTLPLGSSLSGLFGVEQYQYDTGDERYAQKENFALSTDLGGFFTNRAVYDRAYSDGNSPFYFDSGGYLFNTLKDTVTLYRGNDNKFTIDGGYNYITNTYMDLLTKYYFKPNDSLNLDISSGYDIQDGIWRDLVTLITVVPFAGLKDSLSHTYDLNTGKTKLATNLFEWEIGDTWQSKWKIRLGHTFDFTVNKVILQDAEIVKDLHCWELKYTWSDFRKEFRIMLTLKAFPDQPVGYGSGSRGFFMEGTDQVGPVRY